MEFLAIAYHPVNDAMVDRVSPRLAPRRPCDSAQPLPPRRSACTHANPSRDGVWSRRDCSARSPLTSAVAAGVAGLALRCRSTARRESALPRESRRAYQPPLRNPGKSVAAYPPENPPARQFWRPAGSRNVAAGWRRPPPALGWGGVGGELRHLRPPPSCPLAAATAAGPRAPRRRWAKLTGRLARGRAALARPRPRSRPARPCPSRPAAEPARDIISVSDPSHFRAVTTAVTEPGGRRGPSPRRAGTLGRHPACPGRRSGQRSRKRRGAMSVDESNDPSECVSRSLGARGVARCRWATPVCPVGVTRQGVHKGPFAPWGLQDKACTRASSPLDTRLTAGPGPSLPAVPRPLAGVAAPVRRRRSG